MGVRGLVSGATLVLASVCPASAGGSETVFILEGRTVQGHTEIGDPSAPGGWRALGPNDPPQGMAMTLEWRGPVYRFVPDKGQPVLSKEQAMVRDGITIDGVEYELVRKHP
jgi:hypothetical protein